MESNVIGADAFDAPRGFFQKHTNLDAAWFELAKFCENTVKGFAGVKNVVNKDDVTAFDVETKFLGVNQLAGFSAIAITRNAHEIEAKWQFEMANQICQKHDSAVEQRNNDQIAAVKIALDFASQHCYSTANLRFGNEDAADFVAPSARNRR